MQQKIEKIRTCGIKKLTEEEIKEIEEQVHFEIIYDKKNKE